MHKFELYKDRKGETRFRFRAGNGEPMFSSEGYKSKASALKAIESIKKNAPGAPVEEPAPAAKAKAPARKPAAALKTAAKPAVAKAAAKPKAATKPKAAAKPKAPAKTAAKVSA